MAESLDRAAAAATLPRQANGAPELSGAADTNVPRPTWPRTRPRVSRSRYAFTTVVLLTFSAWASSRSAGSRKSRASVPVVMPRSIACAMWRYTGRERGSRPSPRPSSVSCVSSHMLCCLPVHAVFDRQSDPCGHGCVASVGPEDAAARLAGQVHQRRITLLARLAQQGKCRIQVAEARPAERAMIRRDVPRAAHGIELAEDLHRAVAVTLHGHRVRKPRLRRRIVVSGAPGVQITHAPVDVAELQCCGGQQPMRRLEIRFHVDCVAAQLDRLLVPAADVPHPGGRRVGDKAERVELAGA